MLLKYKDNIEFTATWAYGDKGYPYKYFPQNPYKEFKDMWPENEEEELALNLNYFWDIFLKEIKGPKFDNEGWKLWVYQNELTVKTNFIPFKDYIIKLQPGKHWDSKNRKWVNQKAIYYNKNKYYDT